MSDDLKQAVVTALEGVRSLKNGQNEIKEGVITSLNAVSQLDQRETDTRQAAFTALDAAKALDSREKETRQFTEVALEATKELKDVSDSHRVQLVDHEMRIGALEQQETQPAPSSTAQPATTAALAATPELRTDDIPDLPDPVIMVTEGGVAIDRVKRIWLNINQLQENKCDLDATKTNEPSTPTPIRQASIPQRRQGEKCRREEEESRRLTNCFDSEEPSFSEPYDEERPSHRDLTQTSQSRSDFPTLIQQKEKPEKKQKDERNWDRIAITFAVVVLLAAIIYAISASINRTPAPAPQPTTTIVTSSIQSLSVQKTESKQWTVSYPTNQLWVDTGIAVQIGQQVSISVSGTFLNGKYGNQISPEGIGGSSDSGVDPIPGVPMLTSVAKINNGCPINIGRSAIFIADSTGELYLGTKDDCPSDNQGNRIATITIK